MRSRSAKPADAMTERVKQIVSQLNADDFKVREEAQRQLISLGASIVPILKDLRNDQPLEAKQRIDSVLQTLKVPGAGASRTTSGICGFQFAICD